MYRANKHYIDKVLRFFDYISGYESD